MRVVLAMIAILLAAAQQVRAEAEPFSLTLDELQVAQRFSCGGTCGTVRSCEEAVYLWCVCGYARADGDGDGVPCEKVCGDSTQRNLQKVRELMDQFGCR
ncbi:excalibur calcium-binding domain-containing protein [Pannonibacter sp. Q-1]